MSEITNKPMLYVPAGQLEWKGWLISKALPLWSNLGFNAEKSLYYERLTWQGKPAEINALRVMVQARQIATYLRACLDGFYDASEQALRCLENVERLYYRADGNAGWIFSVTQDGKPADCKRDLYAYAFILFAYGWSIRLTGDERYKRIARNTAEEIETIFSSDNGGYIDAAPAVGNGRSQNPHMHLLEAYLVLAEVTGDSFYIEKAKDIVRLARQSLIEKQHGLLLEFFDCEWAPKKPVGHNRVEPGHLFEWAWLFYEYERLVALDNDEKLFLTATTEKFFQAACAWGIDPKTGFVFDAMTEDGTVFERSIRIWPQTELLRLLCKRQTLGRAQHDGDIARLSGAFFERFALARLKGGWIDRFDAKGTIIGDYMPASSLYHIYGPARELC